MDLSKLLGKKLKDDEILDVLERYGVEKVVYDFDRLHEDEPDVYWAGAREHGFLLRFDERQICDVVFCYIQAAEGYSAIDPTGIGVEAFSTFEQAERTCRSKGLEYTVAGPSMAPGWLRVDSGSFKTHYEFKDGALYRITLSAESPE